ncbi:hypothetical protein E2C01_001260 [Portunus trituberculatus]|uniref:Uncharacterized protein n=1 Tax=Portunus trituberculatus TaxID=210409 RepID=A0A5B7CJZ4_PORTR|nr:hypothetical protein [Portunus trituberculatus]
MHRMVAYITKDVTIDTYPYPPQGKKGEQRVIATLHSAHNREDPDSSPDSTKQMGKPVNPLLTCGLAVPPTNQNARAAQEKILFVCGTVRGKGMRGNKEGGKER